jgi:hypothetical protein
MGVYCHIILKQTCEGGTSLRLSRSIPMSVQFLKVFFHIDRSSNTKYTYCTKRTFGI